MRYGHTKQTIKDKKRVYATTFYPKIPIRDDDIFTNITPGTRLDNLAHKYYGDSSLWWIIARANGLTGTELQLKTQQRYRIPMSIKVILRDFASVNSEE
tara:strand:- start:58 stop:354 length:297 start_codon:yes stop_codon:yes gene_type:complete